MARKIGKSCHNMRMETYHTDEYCLKELDNFQSDLKTDWNEVIVENNKCQQIVAKICRLKV